MLKDACADLQAAQERIKMLQTKIAELEKENTELKKRLATSGTTTKLDEPFSLRAEEQRQEARGKKKKKRTETKKQRRGRLANEAKIARAEKTEDVYPSDVPMEKCKLSHVRVVWRLLEGRAVLVA